MKKLLLSFFALSAMSFAANAEVVTFDFTKIDFANTGWSTAYAAHTVAYDEATVVFENADKQNTGGTIDNMPVTKGKSVTVTLKEGTLNAVTFTLKQWGTKTQTATLNVSKDGKEFTTTSTTSSNFVLSSDDLGDDIIAAQVTFSSQNQVGIESITIDYSTGSSEDTRESAGLSYDLTGACVSVYEDELDTFVAPVLSNPNELAVTYETSNETVAEVDEEGVVTLTGDPGEATITATFAGNDSFREGSASYKITVLAALPKVTSVKETIALNTENATAVPCRINYDLTVAFVSFNNVFACDEAGDFIQLYGSNTYKAGSVIPAGWIGNYVFYSKATPEITPATGGAFPTSDETATFTPKAVAPADITAELVNSVIVVKGVEFEEATPDTKTNFTVTVDETAITFRNNYTLASVEAGKYDVTVVVNVYNGAVQLYVIEYTPVIETGITEITTDEAADAVYYNLQGVRVDNPRNGIFVRVAAGKATKVVK